VGGQLEHAHPRLGGQQLDERGIQTVDPPWSLVIMMYRDTTGGAE
jgi:hypothetical protein